ncbi:MAG: hypothetical protein COU25_02145 [Candidatus Levybacteria bacterium CG10_big_fil_rev_8_21_14_0_10_35_13]|nr:MAG: hypothetical protein COU25_02145 [Candidatus Levybacteria bacterium CG10_big_fil_rev_8_21_14_0_10_35_13]
MQKIINKKEVNKIARMIKYPKPNLPVPAVLVICCLIDSLAKGNNDLFVNYVEKRMQKTFEQLENNDSQKSQQISNINCNHDGRKCKKSADILYKHIRCGLVHNYFGSEECEIINRPNKKQEGIIIDQSKKYNKYALVLNGPAFVKDFLISL